MAPRKNDLRACLICSILQDISEFNDDGCPNCEDVVEMKGSLERVIECTSVMWDGMICVIEPQESWVARWQRIGSRGLYAVRVTGVPPQDVIDAISSKGGVYRSRDAVED
ncbi:transcription initiation protein spt4 [Dioszegia hungarica]|uniref:Transcription elongation factor SPT4 n=1 Tax=Dioszegia hungarica TaxID=4972 RepID=A0AA38LR53_9TREE|nr:transcription initiation protein spt4 [Dioszegia hungarica]KAI9633987.1 transcription initiation protein spt4 [Dioszegia hungarica]